MTLSLPQAKGPKVAFTDFWPTFNARNNLFYSILQSRLNASLEEDPAKADILFYSVFGDAHHAFPRTKVFYTGESVIPMGNQCDFALSFMRDEDFLPERHFRLPHWMFSKYVLESGKIEQFPNDPAALTARHRKFCNFIYSNGSAKERVQFLKTLQGYKYVDCAGRFLNNTGITVEDKVAFCSRYKFTIAFENYPSRGYVTEKIADAFAAGSLPIYWGAPDVEQDFNPKRFIHARDFRDFAELVDYIAYLDQHDEAYLSYFCEPLFPEGTMNVDAYMEKLEDFFRNIIASPLQRQASKPLMVSGPMRFKHPMMSRYNDGKPWMKEGPAPLALTTEAKLFRVAACLSSYKRVEDFLRQIFCMMQQSHRHLHVFAALKGVPPSVAEELVFPYVQPFIEEGRLTLRLFPNKNQFSNFLDTIRDLDVSGYDLFAKIDDDDFYSPDYIRHVCDFHAGLPDGYSSWYRGEGSALRRWHGFPSLNRENPLCTGAAQVMSSQVIHKLQFLENDAGEFKSSLMRCKIQTGFQSICFAEDQLFKSMMMDYGCANIAPFLDQQNIRRHLTIQLSNNSVMRGGTLTQNFVENNMQLSQDATHYESVIDLIHNNWKGSVLLFQGRARRLDKSGDEATVDFSSSDKITLTWDNWGTETFVRQTPGVYKFQE